MVRPFIDEYRFSYQILFDPGRKVNEQYNIEGIPKSLVYDSRREAGGTSNRHEDEKTVYGNASASGTALICFSWPSRQDSRKFGKRLTGDPNY